MFLKSFVVYTLLPSPTGGTEHIWPLMSIHYDGLQLQAKCFNKLFSASTDVRLPLPIEVSAHKSGKVTQPWNHGIGT